MSTPTVAHNHDDYVIADRGGIVENRHQIHAAIVDASGQLLYGVGDPGRVTLMRSAAKPAQAAAILETLARADDDDATSTATSNATATATPRSSFARPVRFDDADIALLCASHSSESRHVRRARAMLRMSQAVESDLACGGHAAIMPAQNAAWIRADFVPTPLYNNCSGKHIGMIAGAKILTNGDATGYHRLEHPMQRAVQRTIRDLCALAPADVAWAVDGCNLPAPAVPLRAMGLMYARLAQAASNTTTTPDVHGGRAEDAIASDKDAPQRSTILARIFRCMTTYPELVGGEGRFCTVLMDAFQGMLVGKVGADGCYGVAIRPSAETQRLCGTRHAVGIAVKVEDGNLDILYAAVAEILAQLQLGSPAARRALEPFHHLERRNTAGVVIGHVSFAFKVRKMRSSHPGRDVTASARL